MLQGRLPNYYRGRSCIIDQLHCLKSTGALISKNLTIKTSGYNNLSGSCLYHNIIGDELLLNFGAKFQR